MARRRQGNESPITLFPFLSILACVIGALILMIAGLTLGQVGTRPDDAAVRRAEDYAVLTRQQEARDRERAGLQASTDGLGALQTELERLRQEALRLEARKDALVRTTERERLLAEQLRLQQQLAGLESDYRELQNLAGPLREELARRRDVPTESVVRVEPGGSGSDPRAAPVFVEADATGIVLYDGPEPVRVAKTLIDGHPGFLAAMERVVGNPSAILVFLLRSDGIDAFNLARAVADRRGARYGQLPIVGQGRLDLSLFTAN